MGAEEMKYVNILKWYEKLDFSVLATNYAYNLCEADDTLVELDSYLKEQGMEGLGYSSQTDAIDQITLWYGYLTAFVDNLPYQIDGYLDQPLYKGFVNGATEWLSRIRLEDFTTKMCWESRRKSGIRICMERSMP